MTQRAGPEPIPHEAERSASAVVEAAFRVHRALGPGLLESVYETCLCHELATMGVPFQRQLDLPVHYGSVRLDSGLRLDLVVGGQVVVEVKAVDELTDVHRAQLLTYLKLTTHRVGFLLNFNVARLKDGIVRMVL